MHLVSKVKDDFFYTFADTIKTNIIAFKMLSSKRICGSYTNNISKIEELTMSLRKKKTFVTVE